MRCRPGSGKASLLQITGLSRAVIPTWPSRPGNRSLIRSHGYFRLFLSHVSAHKSADAYLKSELQSQAIIVFVAHEDIVPSSEWQNETELALGSMHALTALLTPDFHPSNRTDQETGFVLGRDNLVIHLPWFRSVWVYRKSSRSRRFT